MDGSPDSAELWRLTWEHSPVGMAIVDLAGRLLLVNRAFSEMLGRDVEELRTRGFQELTHPDDLDMDLRHFERAISGELDSYRLRKRYLHADGHVVWGELSVAVVRDHDARPLHVVSQILDVSEQQEYEQRLQQANAEIEHERQALEAIFETVSVGLLLIDADGNYARMNRRHQETMSLPFPEGHEGRAGQLGHVFRADGTTPLTREEMPSYRAVQGEEFDDYTYWVGADPSTRAAFSTSARQVRGPDGERLGAALAYQEVTDLLRAMQVKDEFVSSVSHELRTPLTAVLGHLELLGEREDLPAGVVRQLEVVQRNAVRLRALVSDLLQVAQVGDGNLRMHRTPTDLVRVVREAVEAARPYAESLGVSVRADVPERLVAHVDEQRIAQVLDNLVANGVKYSEPGDSVTVVLCDAGDALVLEVTDTGIGIAEDEVTQVFGRFFRGGDARDRHIPGTGLGLTIVSSIVAAHRGEVSVESELGRGTTFRVRLPGESA
ncbi:sensor histidine kinase [Nocardioides dongkuii]|uniref:sensor histidine kinase n=1 Tax=Nocardioides dongkuii TaxID=2760089 RepID=UPI0015FB1691|nr:PAS domain-containing sensor histidine kinase [Nocardioides dongkuii]